jgi:phage N-6-adenine-methyltransferase
MLETDNTNWSTPGWLYARVNRAWHPTCDVAASADNAKCTVFYDRHMNGLKQQWVGTVWMNPPYGRGQIWRWVSKACQSALDGTTTVALLPCSTGTDWFQRDVLKFAEYQFLTGRITFGNAPTVAPFWSVLAVFSPHAQAGHKKLI